MSDDSSDELPSAPSQTAAPANQPLHIVPTAVVPAGEQEAAAMLAEQARFNDEPEMKVVATRLLEAGYTVQSAARRLGLRSSTVWSWSKEQDVATAIQNGITPAADSQHATVGVTVDVDFDERLARIVAGAGVKTQTDS